MSESEDVFDRAFRLQVVGTGWAFIGSCFLIFVIAASVAHYGYGTPIYRRRGGGLASEASVLFGMLLFGFAGMGAIAAGIAMRRSARRLTDEAEGLSASVPEA